MRNEIIRELLTEYEQQRARNADEERRRASEIEMNCEDIAELNRRRQQMIFDGLRGILGGGPAGTDLPQQMAQINEQITAALQQAGYPADYLEPVYRCPKCRDTGYVGETIRDMCSCMTGALNSRLYARIGLKNAEEQSFESFDENVFSDENLPGRGYSQRKLMNRACRVCREWADAYPTVEKANILLMGESGLGKTFLMNCMAKRLLQRGQNVLIISAYRFLQVARKAYFSQQPGMLDSVMEADVLFLDDLGTEPLMENITVTQLFNLFNERINAGRATVISTNLNEAELRSRYTERIASRLLDSRGSLLITLQGMDVRKPKGAG